VQEVKGGTGERKLCEIVWVELEARRRCGATLKKFGAVKLEKKIFCQCS
jgi:hypothetical protein